MSVRFTVVFCSSRQKRSAHKYGAYGHDDGERRNDPRASRGGAEPLLGQAAGDRRRSPGLSRDKQFVARAAHIALIAKYNSGPAINAATPMQLFEPLKRGTANKHHPGRPRPRLIYRPRDRQWPQLGGRRVAALGVES